MADALSERKMNSDWPTLANLRCKLLRGCYTQATILTTLRKGEGRSTFVADSQRNNCSCKMGCYT